METTLQRTWKPITVGILNTISGVLYASFIIVLVFTPILSDTWQSILNTLKISPGDYLPFINIFPPESFPFVGPLMPYIVIILLLLPIIPIVFPIIGGVFALQRMKWGWALAGSILAIIAFLPLGIAATVLVTQSKSEFE